MPDEHLPWRAILALLALAMIWGANPAIVKIASVDISPLFMAGIRSLVAAVCMGIWMRFRNIPFFIGRMVLIHWVMIGLLFGLEFAAFYLALAYTLASRVLRAGIHRPVFRGLGSAFFPQGRPPDPGQDHGPSAGLWRRGAPFCAKRFREIFLEHPAGRPAGPHCRAFVGGPPRCISRNFWGKAPTPCRPCSMQLVVSAPLLFSC